MPPATISATLLAFARPLLQAVGAPASADEMNSLLRVAVTVWNAVVLEQSGHAGRYLAEARGLVEAQALPAAARVFEALVEWKHQAFEDDRRLILDYRVVQDPQGRLGVEVSAGSAVDLSPPPASSTPQVS